MARVGCEVNRIGAPPVPAFGKGMSHSFVEKLLNASHPCPNAHLITPESLFPHGRLYRGGLQFHGKHGFPGQTGLA
jgi:hypothetical protein